MHMRATDKVNVHAGAMGEIDACGGSAHLSLIRSVTTYSLRCGGCFIAERSGTSLEPAWIVTLHPITVAT